MISVSQTDLEVVFTMNRQSCAEDVAYDDDVCLRVVDGDSVHSEILWQQRVGVPLDNILCVHINHHIPQTSHSQIPKTITNTIACHAKEPLIMDTDILYSNSKF